MKTVLLIIISSIFLLNDVRAQQRPHYTQYMLNQYILNPALTGIEDYTDIKMSHRNQWSGFQGAPVTSFLTVNTAIGKKRNNNYRQYMNDVSTFQSQGNWDDGDPMDPYHGIGLQLINDVIGPFNSFSGFLTYGYHMSLNSTTRLSAGLGAGLNNQRLNLKDLNFGNNATIDPAIFPQTEIGGRGRLDLNFGLWLYKRNFFTGLSVQQIVPQFVGSTNINSPVFNGGNVPHFFYTTGYSMNVQPGFSIMTSLMLKYVAASPIQADINVKGQIGDIFFIGASYRSKYGFAGLGGLTLNNRWIVSYSYDYTTTILNRVSNGSHEVMLGFRLINDKILPCPVGVW